MAHARPLLRLSSRPLFSFRLLFPLGRSRMVFGIKKKYPQDHKNIQGIKNDATHGFASSIVSPRPPPAMSKLHHLPSPSGPRFRSPTHNSRPPAPTAHPRTAVGGCFCCQTIFSLGSLFLSLTPPLALSRHRHPASPYHPQTHTHVTRVHACMHAWLAAAGVGVGAHKTNAAAAGLFLFRCRGRACPRAC